MRPSYMSCTAQGEDVSINTWTQTPPERECMHVEFLHAETPHACTLSAPCQALVFLSSPWMPHHTSQTKGGPQHQRFVDTRGRFSPTNTPRDGGAAGQAYRNFHEKKKRKTKQNTRLTAFWCQKWRKVYPQSGACSAATALILIHL